MANRIIREAAQKNGVLLWQLAYAVGVNDSTFSRRLRKELPQEEQEKLLKNAALGHAYIPLFPQSRHG